jgi:hypothetical protein
MAAARLLAPQTTRYCILQVGASEKGESRRWRHEATRASLRSPLLQVERVGMFRSTWRSGQNPVGRSRRADAP